MNLFHNYIFFFIGSSHWSLSRFIDILINFNLVGWVQGIFNRKLPFIVQNLGFRGSSELSVGDRVLVGGCG